MSTHPDAISTRAANRFQRAAGRLSGRIERMRIRGQLGPIQETQLARLTGARR